MALYRENSPSSTRTTSTESTKDQGPVISDTLKTFTVNISLHAPSSNRYTNDDTMENGGVDSSFSGPRRTARRMHRSDSIPENSEAATGETGTADASIEELLMRHSSPIFNGRTGEAVTSPLAERNSSPSPLRLNRPRSNPRSRTPMRITEHEEEEQEGRTSSAAESGRITIRLGSGSAVGSNTVSYASRRVRTSFGFVCELTMMVARGGWLKVA